MEISGLLPITVHPFGWVWRDLHARPVITS
jgi:hypothetical protein